MLERTVEAALVKAAQEAGGRAWKWVSPSNRGVPDRIVTLPGMPPFAVELKAPGQKPTALQRSIHEALRRMGMTVYVVDSPDEARALIRLVTDR